MSDTTVSDTTMSDTTVSDTTFGDRYRAVGLAGNPFTAPQLGAPSCAAFVSRGLPDPPPPWSRTLVQVIGESGFGKSSQLEAWRDRLPGPSHYVPRQPYAKRWKRPPSARASAGVIYGDEICRMPAPLRHAWFGSLAGLEATLVVGTHVDLERLGSRAGFEVVTHHLAPFDRPTLERAIRARLRATAGEGADSSALDALFTSADIDHIHAESGGIPRRAEMLCHRVLARLVG